MSEGDRIGSRVVARLSSGVPTDRAIIEQLPDRWRALADELGRAQSEARRGIRKRHLDSWGDGRAMLAAILQANPHEDPLTEPVQETGARARFALKSVAEIRAMKPPTYQIAGHIPRGGLVVVFGPSGSGKTFEGIEIACSIASGEPWHGLEAVEAGPVVYVTGEGVSGVGKRLAAWEHEHPGAELGQLHFIVEPVNLMDPVEVDAFMAVLRTLPEPPAAVLFDTLARCMVTGDENSSRDMGIAVASMDRIRHEFGATVIPIHHTGKSGEDERGSSALRGAADTMIKVVGDGSVSTLTCIKQKDDEEFKPIVLRLRPVEGTGSCVFEYSDYRGSTELRPKARELLEILDSHFTAEGAATSVWKDVSKQAPNTFFSARRDLIRLGYVAHDGTRGGRHTLTDLGRNELGIEPELPTTDELPSNYHGSNPEPPLLLPTTTAARKGGSGSSSNGRAPVPPGRPENGVYEGINAAVDEIGGVP